MRVWENEFLQIQILPVVVWGSVKAYLSSFEFSEMTQPWYRTWRMRNFDNSDFGQKITDFGIREEWRMEFGSLMWLKKDTN